MRAKIVDSAKRGEANTRCIGKPRDKASGDFGRNPLGAGAILAADSRWTQHLFDDLVSITGRQAKIVTAQRVFHCVRDSKPSVITFLVPSRPLES